jgi:hypothetical protein
MRATVPVPTAFGLAIASEHWQLCRNQDDADRESAFVEQLAAARLNGSAP